MSTVSFNAATTTNFIDRLHPAFLDGDAESANKPTEADHVRKLQDFYRALARGDLTALDALLADDIDMEMIGPAEVPLAGRHRGKQQAAEAVRRNYSLLEDQQAEILSVVAQGDTVVLHARECGRYKPTGKPYDIHWVQFFTFRDGRLARFRGLFDSAAFLEAVRPG